MIELGVAHLEGIEKLNPRGIIAGTLVTLVFVPALYCAVFRVRPGRA